MQDEVGGLLVHGGQEGEGGGVGSRTLGERKRMRTRPHMAKLVGNEQVSGPPSQMISCASLDSFV